MDYTLFITQTLQRSIHFVLPFVIAFNLIYVFRRLAPTLGLVDKPDERKTHTGSIPLVGGPAMFVAIAVSASLLVPQFQVLIFLVLCGCMVLLGVVDDHIGLRPSLRLIAQCTVALGMAGYASVSILNVGNLVGLGPVVLHGAISLLFTVMCTIGAINAINMIDGVDGLAGSILTISFSAMCWLAWDNGDWVSARLLTIFVGALVAFLVFNARLFVSKAKIFMGDSGSMLMGLILVWFLIRLTQGDAPAMSPVVAGWIFGLPLIDTISVMVGRLRSRRHVFEAGRDHFHHKLLDSGFTVNQTVLCAAAIHTVFVGIGVLSNNSPELEPVLFWAFVASVVLHHFLTPMVLRHLSHKLNREPS